MLESLNTGVFEYEKLKPEEMKARGILGRLVGVMADTVNPTRNGRSYSAKLWDNVFNNPIMKERIENKCCFGELGHPIDREETDMEKIAICMDALPKKDKDGKLQAVFNILDTPNGRILKTLCDYGCNIGISSRGSGDLVKDFDGNESVDPDTYNCEGWDAVLIPAVKEARLKYVTESLDKTRYNKSLRAKLQEAVDKADEDHKKSMTESLHTFLGEGIWDEIENDVEQPEAGPEPDEEFVDELDNNTSQEETIEPPADDPLDIEGDEGGLDDLDLDIQEEPKKTDEVYKGVHIIEDPDSGKFVCEINKETYVFNSEKNAKIWIDMNENDIQSDKEKETNISESLNEEMINIPSSAEKIVKYNAFQNATNEGHPIYVKIDDEVYTVFASTDTTYRVLYSKEGWKDRDKVFDEIVKDGGEIFVDWSEHGLYANSNSGKIIKNLNEEQIGRDTHKEDKDADDVQHQEERKEDSEDEENSVTITVNESMGSDWAELNGTEQSAVDHIVSRLDLYSNLDDLKFDCQQAVSMYNDANSFDEYENEDFYGDEGDWVSVYNFIMNHYKPENLDENLKESTLKYNEIRANEADNVGSEVDSLKEMLDHNMKLEQRIIELQEKLSVSHAEENRLTESVASLKEKIAKLSQVSKENIALKEQLKTAKDSKKKLNESVANNTSLKESLDKANKENKSLKTELESLKEEYSTLDKDSKQINEALASKVENQNKLLEKYQKITKNAVDKYINLQATNLGVRSAEIRNKLPERFSFSDVDSICEELRDYKLSVSKLPFNTSRALKEGNVRVNNLGKTLRPRNEVDELTDYDLKLMELYK